MAISMGIVTCRSTSSAALAGIGGDDLDHLPGDVGVSVDLLVLEGPDAQRRPAPASAETSQRWLQGQVGSGRESWAGCSLPDGLPSSPTGLAAGLCRQPGCRTMKGFSRIAPDPITRSPAFNPWRISTRLPYCSPILTSVIRPDPRLGGHEHVVRPAHVQHAVGGNHAALARTPSPGRSRRTSPA